MFLSPVGAQVPLFGDNCPKNHRCVLVWCPGVYCTATAWINRFSHIAIRHNLSADFFSVGVARDKNRPGSKKSVALPRIFINQADFCPLIHQFVDKLSH